MEHIIERLRSFSTEDNEITVMMASVGFYREHYSRHGDAVRCYFCRIVLYDWLPGVNVIKAHVR